MSQYDSRQDTLKHREQVQNAIEGFVNELLRRGEIHDESKLHSPEKEVFDEVTPRLRSLTYGSQEYKESLAEMGNALQHHYENNPHHPEHYDGGINDMSLIDLVEMYCDWFAATKRHADGDMGKSIVHNSVRFSMSEQLERIFWITHERGIASTPKANDRDGKGDEVTASEATETLAKIFQKDHEAARLFQYGIYADALDVLARLVAGGDSGCIDLDDAGDIANDIASRFMKQTFDVETSGDGPMCDGKDDDCNNDDGNNDDGIKKRVVTAIIERNGNDLSYGVSCDPLIPNKDKLEEYDLEEVMAYVATQKLMEVPRAMEKFDKS